MYVLDFKKWIDYYKNVLYGYINLYFIYGRKNKIGGVLMGLIK